MKKFVIIFSICLAAVIFFTSKAGQTVSTAKIYYVDRQLHRLIPVETEIKSGDARKETEQIVKKLEQGRNSDSVLKLIHISDEEISVKVNKDTAEVNLPLSLKENVPKNRESERLIIYQLVNSLTSIPEIKYVTFTINHERRSDFIGFLDMREIFTPCYDI
ncbi:MAG: GerMN domain-containing protein [Clostridiales bacterium]|nr:GerMN domain-containing protein [Clostridiales bacterium]